MPRLIPLAAAAYSDAQRHVADEVRGGRRGTVPANVEAWLRSPELAARAARLGEFVRYETALPPALSELAILVVARRWRAHYEWAVHAGEAARAGVTPPVIAAIAAGEAPVLDADAAAAVYGFARDLVTDGRVSDARYAAAVGALGEAGVVDLVAVVGYYTLVAFTLNAFEVAAPDGAPRLP